MGSKQDSNASKTLLKVSAMITVALSMMGNKGCEQKPPQEGPRTTLRERIMFEQITSNPMNLGLGGQFDFGFVANAQMYTTLQNSNRFSIFYGSANTVAQSNSRRALPDEELFGTWAFEAGYQPMATYSEVQKCLLNRTQVVVRGSIRSFEASSGGGIGIGFGPNFGLQLPISLGLKIKKANLDVGLEAYSPFTSHQIATGEAIGKQTETNLDFSIDLGGITLGPSYWFKTPLAEVTRNAFYLALQNLIKNMDGVGHKWSSFVVADHDTHVVVQGGKDVNMKVGDVLEIWKRDYYQMSDGCDNIDSVDKFNEPVAVIQIETLGDTIARGRVIQQTDVRVDTGDMVKIRSLVADTGTNQPVQP